MHACTFIESPKGREGKELFLRSITPPHPHYPGSDILIVNAMPGRVAQSVGRLTQKLGVLGSIPGLATYFRFSFRFFKKGSCQLLAKVCARSTG